MRRSDLEKAAFWEQQVCVDCEAAFDASDAVEGRCPECGSTQVVPAAAALALFDAIGEDEE